MIFRFGTFVLADFDAKTPGDWNDAEVAAADVVRVRLSADAGTVVEMQRRGFIWVDRTLKTTVRTSKLPNDLEKSIRLPIVEESIADFSSERRADVLRIAVDSFVDDRRFHLLPNCSREISEMVLSEKIAELTTILTAPFRGRTVGFLAPQTIDSDVWFVELAAVEERFRATGAAISLYAEAFRLARERGLRRVEGRIGSKNVAVANLYASFGATFSEPLDVFLKETETKRTFHVGRTGEAFVETERESRK